MVRGLGLRHQLITPYTSLVVTDRAPAQCTAEQTAAVPHEVPAGMVARLGLMIREEPAADMPGEGRLRVYGSPLVLGALDKSVIDRVIRSNMTQLRYCYTKHPAQGRATLKITIGPDGVVREVEVVGSTLQHAQLETCLAEQAEGMQFPKPRGGGIVIVTYPMVFGAAE